MTVVGRVVAAGMIVAASIVLGGSAQAAETMWQSDSADQITSPSDGQVITGSSVTISARTGIVQLNMGLYVEGPDTPSQKVAGGGANQTISGTFDTGNAPNGTFTVTLRGELTNSTYATSTFKLRRPPEAPGNVNASMQGTSKVLVTWGKGSEPDLQSYEVSSTRSGIVGRLSADSACGGSSCEAALAVPENAAGQRVGFTVKAFRGDGDGGLVGSGDSPATYISFPAKPTAQPKKTTGSRRTPKANDAKNVDPLPTLPSGQRSVPTSKPATPKQSSKLPDMPNTDENGNLPIPTTNDQGGTDGLAPAGTTDGAGSAPVQTSDVKAQSSESPLANINQYGFYVAGGLLLLLLGAHGGAWARRRALAASAANPMPAATTTAGAGAPSADGVRVTRANEGAPPTRTTPRRPAVILAVAKTRVPEQSRTRTPSSPGDGRQAAAEPERAQSSTPERARKEVPAARALYLGTGDVRALEGGGVEDQDAVRSAAGISGAAETELGAAAEVRLRDLREVEVRTVREAKDDTRGGTQGRANDAPQGYVRGNGSPQGHMSGEGGGPACGDGEGWDERGGLVYSDEAARGRGECDELFYNGEVGRSRGEGEGRSPGEGGGRPRGEEEGRSRDEGERRSRGEREGQEWGEGVGQVGAKGPVRIALPSSAVTDVSASSASESPRASVSIEDRWDDYLPPSPRAMEDSGFWERPQPGAADFWAADDDDDENDVTGAGDERTFAGRRHLNGDS
ncbi:hypothetical protein [Nonomuraea jiangxiensis]|uniref:hypothetical protein n=1 Tax=Nonomuraea jiangxiensis TaxID=633440 RepID=UPI000AB41B56|nr:hypothetical protein [Nonomuraea jiangxiensis]